MVQSTGFTPRLGQYSIGANSERSARTEATAETDRVRKRKTGMEVDFNSRLQASAAEQGALRGRLEAAAEDATKRESQVAELQEQVKVLELRVGRTESELEFAKTAVPKLNGTWATLREAKMEAEARELILADKSWLTASQLAKLAGMTEADASAQLSTWKTDGSIFGVRHDGQEYVPLYGLDPKKQYRPRKEFGPILKCLGQKRDEWGIAY